ncbi:hypothetical protein J2Z76_001820 [Sedimentibacter acidaminivorans]|uniref:Transcriptional regulator n=1 Tax=Sedimentibacter acidaminivorans TaxID=913099 RepID=A0ABS4GE24_9FIRM|nr:transcriptional regulator [Sedimentibacter acidaminivorans]MBP1925956.1 hypothetical protein [Sedimentibacter acidaminivorans]
MEFNEKLDYLMKITKTTNSSLALYTSLDASYVSRLRRGDRKPAKNGNYIMPMAVYFSKHCNEKYQIEILSETIKVKTSVILDNESAAEVIYEWMLKNDDEKKPVEDLLYKISNFSYKRKPNIKNNEDVHMVSWNNIEPKVYYGVDGKREAVIQFLSIVINNKIPQTLLLFSDENTEWLFGDLTFTEKWANLMTKVIMGGNKIKIIHTVSRDLDEMLSAISQWLPLYMTGAIEPFFYPKKRDGVFKRTLFIAPDTAAVTSSSISSMTKNAANFVLREKNTIKALLGEFNDYLSLCRPLMKIFTLGDKDKYLEELHEFENEESNSLISTDTLSVLTMPMCVAEKISKRLTVENYNYDGLLTYSQLRRQNFEKKLHINKFIDIIKISDIYSVKSGQVKTAISNIVIKENICYNTEEYILHLENILFLMRNYNNYNVYIQNNNSSVNGYTLYVKEDIGVIIEKTSFPPVIFAINESNMTAAFWDYLDSIVGSINRKNTIKKLEKIIADLKNLK